MGGAGPINELIREAGARWHKPHRFQIVASAVRPGAMSISTLAVWFLWAALIYVVALLVLPVRTSSRDPEFSEIRIWLLCLLENGYVGENILFRDTRSRRFIRFQKYNGDGGAPGIELTFPGIGWGEEFVPRLRDYAGRKGLTFEESEENAPGYVQVKCGRDIDQAFALCRMIWSGFYGFSEAARYLRQFGDLSDVDELMDDSAPSRKSTAEGRQRWNLYMNARLRHAGLGWLQAADMTGSMLRFGAPTLVSGLSFLAALISLPLATVLSLDDPPAWQVQLGPVGLQGGTASLIWFLVYLVSNEVLRRCLRFRLIDRQSMTRMEEILHAPKRLAVVAIPIAVVLVWLGI